DVATMWGRVNGAVGSYRDLRTPLITAVERLIDFVTDPGRARPGSGGARSVAADGSGRMGRMAWWGWLIVAVALSGAEAIGGEFVLLMLGGGALVTTIAAIGIGSLWLQMVIFAIASLILVF